jgi:hypothetical protein
MRLLASALALGILSGTACAQTPPAPVTVNIEGRSIRLVVPAGHCALDQNQEIDRQVLDLTARAIGQNDLLLYTTDCRSLTDMRARRLNVLADFSQVQITKALRTVDLAGQETRSIQQVCNELRTNNDLAKRVDQEIKDRIRDLQQNIAINETRSLGVLGEDSTACYSGALITVSDTNGTRLVIGIYAITVLNGRMTSLAPSAERRMPIPASPCWRSACRRRRCRRCWRRCPATGFRNPPVSRSLVRPPMGNGASGLRVIGCDSTISTIGWFAGSRNRPSRVAAAGFDPMKPRSSSPRPVFRSRREPQPLTRPRRSITRRASDIRWS